MAWRRLKEPVEIRYAGLDKFRGVEVELRPRSVIITVKRGVAFCGRPIYHYEYSFKGRRLRGGKALLTHWFFHEEPAPMGPATLGFGLFFPEIIESAYRKTPREEQEEGLVAIIEDLKKMERALEQEGQGRTAGQEQKQE